MLKSPPGDEFDIEKLNQRLVQQAEAYEASLEEKREKEPGVVRSRDQSVGIAVCFGWISSFGEGDQPNGTHFRIALLHTGSPLPINSDGKTTQANQALSEFLGRGGPYFILKT